MPLIRPHCPFGAGTAVAALLSLGCRPASPYDDVPVTSATLVDFDHDALAILGGPVGGDALLVFDGPDGGGSIPVAMRGGMAGVALEMSLDLNPNANVELDFSRADDDVSLADLLSRYRGGAWSVGVLLGGSGRSLHNRAGVGLNEAHFMFGAGVLVGVEWLRLEEGGNEVGDDWGWQDWGSGDTGWTGADTGWSDTGQGDGADSGGSTGDSGADGSDGDDGEGADAGSGGTQTSSGCGGGGSSSDDDDGGDDGGGSDGDDGGSTDGGGSDGGGSDGGSDGGGSDGGGGGSSSSGGCSGGGGSACDSLCSSSASLSMLFLGAWGLRRRRDPGPTSSPPSR